jgi:DNA helicase II / ATP-dependent DNA helicase PcrA
MTPALTDEQLAIIGTPAGPLRIDAGAGTGKTFTLVRLVERRVAEGTPPERILGITFTNKAAAELAGRIRAAVGGVGEPGMEVDVHTYHGFAGRLLAEFGPFVGVERGARVITPAFTRQLLHEVLGSAGDLPSLDLTAAPQRIDEAARLAGTLTDNLVDATALRGEHDPDDLTAKRSDLAAVIEAFAAEKRRLGVIDYGDMISLAHRLVTTRRDVAERVRDRYDLVLLDEYQDTAPAQRLLLQALFGGGMPVVAVGDADQTIYEWRGASLENFAEFPAHFPTVDGTPGPTLPLTVNRRSGQSILDVANAVRAKAGDAPRLPLVAAEGTPPGRVTIGWYRTALDEATAIADLAIEHHTAGVDWSGMAVLLRANKDIALVRQALADAGVPSEVASLGGLLDVPEVVDLHAWLRVLENPTDGVAFARLATGSRYRLGLADLKPLADWAGEHDRVGRSPTEALDHLESLSLRPDAAVALVNLRAHIRALLPVAQVTSLVELVREILATTGAWHDIESLPPAAALSARLNVYRFLDLAEAWSPLEGRPSLEAFLGYLQVLRDSPTDELDTARISGEDAVTLLTVHRAKGLEWDVVFLPALADGRFPTPVRAFEDPHRNVAVLPHHLRLDRHTLPHLDPDDKKQRDEVLRERHLRSEWRLAYVAVTRARQVLHLSGASWYGIPEPTVNPKDRSPVLAEVADLPGVEVIADEEPGDRPTTLMPPPSAHAPDPLFPEGWAGAVRAAIADPGLARRLANDLDVVAAYDAAVDAHQDMLFSLPDPPVVDTEPLVPTLSVSGAVTYARCPRQYRWTFVEPLPRRPNPAAGRGIAVHRLIELHNLGRVPLDDVRESTYDVADLPEPGPTVPPVGPDPHATFLSSRFAAVKPLFVEAPFELRHHGAVLRGRIDAVYGTPDHWEVVDFKSGRPRDDEALDLQLDAYAVAVVDGAVSPAPPASVTVTFAYLGGGLTERSWEITPDALTSARERLTRVVEGVVAGNHEPTPSDACSACDFAMVCDVGRSHLAAS